MSKSLRTLMLTLGFVFVAVFSKVAFSQVDLEPDLSPIGASTME